MYVRCAAAAESCSGWIRTSTEKTDIHVHVPEGATPKDGPVRGYCDGDVDRVGPHRHPPVRKDVAMTRRNHAAQGAFLPIGGLKEKLLAAHRGGITTVLIPSENEKDLVEIPENIKGKLDIRPVKWIDEVLDLALERPPRPLAGAAELTA